MTRLTKPRGLLIHYELDSLLYFLLFEFLATFKNMVLFAKEAFENQALWTEVPWRLFLRSANSEAVCLEFSFSSSWPSLPCGVVHTTSSFSLQRIRREDLVICQLLFTLNVPDESDCYRLRAWFCSGLMSVTTPLYSGQWLWFRVF